jgi:uncharacterized protein with PIN domain
MPKVNISVQGELNQLLTKKNRFKVLTIKFQGRQSIKHIIESLGIPHTEIGMLVANDKPADFDYLVQQGDQITVQAASPINDRYSGMFANGRLVVEPHFILDNHLGKLATYLRVLGIDAIYRNDFQDDELAADSINLNRILLTRDRQLLMRKSIRFGYLIRSLQPEEQVIEIFRRFNLTGIVNPYHRCLRCNIQLVPVDKKTILHRLQPKTKKYFQDFHLCPSCERVYWRGSHFDRMDQMVTNLLSDL